MSFRSFSDLAIIKNKKYIPKFDKFSKKSYKRNMKLLHYAALASLLATLVLPVYVNAGG